MAFLFPKLFPGCVAEDNNPNASLSLENAMALYWKAVSLQLVASCTDDDETFSLNITITTTETLDDLVCGAAAVFVGLDQYGILRGLQVGSSAHKQGDLYVSGLYGQFIPGTNEGGRILLFYTNITPTSSISFQGQSIGCTFFNDDTNKILSGSGSLTIIAERTFD